MECSFLVDCLVVKQLAEVFCFFELFCQLVSAVTVFAYKSTLTSYLNEKYQNKVIA